MEGSFPPLMTPREKRDFPQRRKCHAEIEIQRSADRGNAEGSGGRRGGRRCHAQTRVSAATFYKWRAKFGGMGTSDMARLRELERENARLKRMYADLSLEHQVATEALGKKW